MVRRPLGARSSGVEHLTFNQRVDGSIPSGLTNFMSVFALPILVLMTSAALADPQSAARAQTSAAPSPTGNSHTCYEWYPPAALAAGEEGKTTLSFRIGTDGVPKNISVVSGSGFADLDEAAAKCAAAWKYRPATAGGLPVEADWKATVEWSKSPGKTVYLTLGRGHMAAEPATDHQQLIGSPVCPNPMRPAAPLGRISTVMFWVLPDGSITHLKLIRSSGDDKLDALALECAAQWRYTPLQDGSARHVRVMFVPIPW